MPPPDPLLPDEMVIHGALLDAVQLQPPAPATVTGTLPPALGTFWLVGEIEKLHPPSCVSVKFCPPAEIVAERCGPAFGAAAYRTVPFPLPVAPLVIVSHV